jgi:hypothetical protein
MCNVVNESEQDPFSRFLLMMKNMNKGKTKDKTFFGGRCKQDMNTHDIFSFGESEKWTD